MLFGDPPGVAWDLGWSTHGVGVAAEDAVVLPCVYDVGILLEPVQPDAVVGRWMQRKMPSYCAKLIEDQC